MKKLIAVWLAVFALALAGLALFTKPADAAVPDTSTVTTTAGDTVVKATILDGSKWPEVLLSLECTGTEVDSVVTECRKALLAWCPDGGNIEAIAETPEGVLPLGIALVVRCVHEPSI